VVRELILLANTVDNPATQSLSILFDDHELSKEAPYRELVSGLETYFDKLPPSELLGMPLFEFLRASIKACPDSLEGQLEYLLGKWGDLLPETFRTRILMTRDMIQEETRPRGFGPGPTEILTFTKPTTVEGQFYPEYERFTPDRDWMSNVVLIAKSVYVWLHQLSEIYGTEIRLLSEIPDEELQKLAGWGFSGLWLIGVWQRAHASEQIKRIRGNPEAMASAYSLHDYIIAEDLGGEAAYRDLRDRAGQYGLRLASDMVPNHMGLDSRWVIEHPDWFIQLDYPPFPNYRFTGTDLSRDWRVSLRVEDGYWDHRDAAVVFQRVDNWTGNVRYVYHGNDGTHMPWNDTAQLNYLLPEVREAVIQTILHVARMFPIIRFDAAMTLTRRHFQRLWFPLPGQGGDIPSRAEQGLSRDEFNERMPEEFWREVVDRIAVEAPDTLLLAEAFWLMEGYFVRTLGMHRVYNSAFMNMLKTEENANYRCTIKNVLEFSPEVLRRFVNFMNNPDEKTAVEQFGKGDKYCGICMLMVTMPGLPMLGHGQIEGFAEKYGMEYRRAYWNESVDKDLVHRHEREIFPLMRRRAMFSGVEHFALYDFHMPEGQVNEDVYAYSNRNGAERSIVFYNNRLNSTSGWIHHSTPVNIGRQEETNLTTRTLGEALALSSEANVFYIFRDHRDQLEYLRSGKELCEEGLFVQLAGYQYHVFLDFREVVDQDGTWQQLNLKVQGKDTADMMITYRELQVGALLDAFTQYLGDGYAYLKQAKIADASQEKLVAALIDLQKTARLYNLNGTIDAAAVVEQLLQARPLLQNQPLHIQQALLDLGAQRECILAGDPTSTLPERLSPLLPLYLLTSAVEPLFTAEQETDSAIFWMDPWLLEGRIRSFCEELDHIESDQEDPLPDLARLVRIGLAHPLFPSHESVDSVGQIDRQPAPLYRFFKNLVEDQRCAEYLLLHQYEGNEWINRERLELVLVNFYIKERMSLSMENIKPRLPGNQALYHQLILQNLGEILDTALVGGYQVQRILNLLSEEMTFNEKG
jgi:glycosidase